MAIRPRTTLKSWFYRMAKPVSSQFHDWIDSFYHKDEDSSYVGLRVYHESTIYDPGMTCVHGGFIWMSNQSTTGAWNALAWDQLSQPTPSAGGQNTIVVKSGETITIDENKQSFVYGGVTVEDDGKLVVNGEQVIANGALNIDEGGEVVLDGDLKLPHFVES